MRTKGNGLVRREAIPASSLVPDGEHPARLAEQFTFANAFGERLGFLYEVEGGPHAGAVLVQSAVRSPSPTGKLAEILRDLVGRDPTPDELLEGIGEEYLGLPCRVLTREERNRAGKRYSAVQRVSR